MFRKDLPELIVSNDMISKPILGARLNVFALPARLDLAQDEIADLEDELAVKTAARNAFEAQMTAFVAQHPDSPLCADSGQRFKNGDVKSQAWLVWEAAFDATLKTFGVTDPSTRRID